MNILRHSLKKLALLCAASLLAFHAAADDLCFEIDGIRYAFNGLPTTTTCRVADGGHAGKKVIIPETVLYEGRAMTVTAIGDSAFIGCAGLAEITIPESVTAIGRCAFSGCASLEKVVLGSSVSHLGGGVFNDCPNITSVYSWNPEPPTFEGSNDEEYFSGNVYDDATLYVPIGSLCYAYQTADVWKGFASKQEARQATEDPLEVGLLTCSPGSEVYALYGHTAIRVVNRATGEDWVFNYGLFSFNQPHFVWRFVLGECDYWVGAMPFCDFAREYEERGSTVYQQDLNLTPFEKRRLCALLAENMRPENRKYRYNFFYDNCTTRARDRIEEAVEGTVAYPPQDTVRTYREITRQYTRDYPWAGLGNDLCLGAEADRPLSVRAEMFAPFYLLRNAEEAVICDSAGGVRPLVLSTRKVVRGAGVPAREEFPLSPSACAWLLAAAVAVLTAAERWRGACFWGLDAVLMTLTGAAGLVVTFLFFFSVHPTVGSNWQIWVFNPLPLLAMPWVVWCGIRRRKTLYHPANAVILCLFIVFLGFIPQDFSVVVVPLALILLLRSCSYCISYREKNRIRPK